MVWVMLADHASSTTATHSTDDHLESIAVNARQAAALFGLSERAWRRANSAGLVPASLKISGAVRWGLRELRLWAEAGCPSRAQWDARKKLPAAVGPSRQRNQELHDELIAT